MMPPTPSFLSAPLVPIDALDARFAVLGIPYGVPYDTRNLGASVCEAPRAKSTSQTCSEKACLSRPKITWVPGE